MVAAAPRGGGKNASAKAAKNAAANNLGNNAGNSASSKVTEVRFWSLGEITRVAIEVSGEFKYRSERLPNPDRLVFDIQGAKPALTSKRMHVIAVGDTLVKQIRVAETQPGVTRVVLDLEKPADFAASQSSEPVRLMIEVRSQDRPGPPVGASTTGAQKIRETPAKTPTPDLTGASGQGPGASKESLIARATLPPMSSVGPPSVTPPAPPPISSIAPPASVAAPTNINIAAPK